MCVRALEEQVKAGLDLKTMLLQLKKRSFVAPVSLHDCECFLVMFAIQAIYCSKGGQI